MRKLFYAGFCLVLAMGVGCAITNYGLITDNDQTNNGQGSGVVNTNGKAKLIPSAQSAFIYDDGTEELFSMVDQNSSGDRVISTYRNFSSFDEPIFHDDLYCNPDWQGCAIWTAQDPEVGDVDIFDGAWNANCPGSRSLSVLLSTGRYYGECGRAKLGVADRIALGAMGTIVTRHGQEGLFFGLNRNNLNIRLDNNAGTVMNLPVIGDSGLFIGGSGRLQASVDLTNPLMANMARNFADFLRSWGTNHTTMTFTYNGISYSMDVGGEIMSASNVLSFAQRKL